MSLKVNRHTYTYTNLGRFVTSIFVSILSIYSQNKIAILFSVISFVFSFFWIKADKYILYKQLHKFISYIPAMHDVFMITILIYVTGNISSPNVIFYIAILTIASSESNRDSSQSILIIIQSNIMYLFVNLLIYSEQLESISILSDKFYQELSLYNIVVSQFFLILCETVLFLTINRISKENKKNFDIQVSLKKKAEENIKQLKEAQLKLVRTEKMAELGQLVSSISHEMNTPLSVIKSNVELMDYDIAIILKQVPSFLETLNKEEKRIFNEVIANSKMTSATYLLEERQRRKEIKSQLRNIIEPEDPSFESFVELTLKLRIENILEAIILNLGQQKTLEILKIAEIFFNLNKYLERIKISIDKTNKVIFALKNYSNTNSNQEKVKVNISSEIERILKLQESFTSGRIVIRKDIPSSIDYYCNKENLFQVWNNIIYNSIQSLLSSGKKKLDITAEISPDVQDKLIGMIGDDSKRFVDRKDYLTVSIVDNGCGIPSMLQDKIFTPFFTSKTLGEGVGLGLYISRKIILDHGGGIFFKSSENRTEFLIVLC